METEKRAPIASETVIKLDYPVEHAGQTYSEIVMRRPKGKHLKGMKINDLGFGDMIKVASKISATSVAVFDEMDTSDLNKVWDFLGEHL